MLEIKKSKIDHSINYIKKFGNGFLESRYVERDGYYIIYLSSQSGCMYSCRFCHLTATKQTSFDQSTVFDFLEQAKYALDHNNKNKVVHFNWMARGEPLANPNILNHSKDLFDKLSELVSDHEVKFNISTILPNDLDTKAFMQIDKRANFYYSIYSMDKDFRKRWMPKALDPLVGLKILKEKQELSGNNVIIHYALIKDQNDSIKDQDNIINAIKMSGLKTRINFVKYNPYEEKYGEESDILQQELILNLAKEKINTNSRIVSRVGFDVKASCGMFIGGKNDK